MFLFFINFYFYLFLVITFFVFKEIYFTKGKIKKILFSATFFINDSRQYIYMSNKKRSFLGNVSSIERGFTKYEKNI